MVKKCLILLILFLFIFTLSTWAAPPWQEEENLKGVEAFFDDLKRAYETENINLFLNLFAPYTGSTDTERNFDLVYTHEMMQEELALTFAGVSNLQADFTEMEIQLKDNFAMVRTLRIIKAEETPYINVRMVFTMQKKNNGWGNQRWEIINQVLLDEWYDFVATVSTTGDDSKSKPKSEKQVKPYGRSILF